MPSTVVRNGQARKREAAIAALLSTRTIGEAARQAQIGERTLIRWLQEPDFSEAYRTTQSRLLEGALNHLRERATDFAKTIAEVASDEEQPGAVRYGAAAKGLELLMRAHGTQDLESKLGELEQLVQQLMESHR